MRSIKRPRSIQIITAACIVSLSFIAGCKKDAAPEIVIVDGDLTPDGQFEFDIFLTDEAAIQGDFISIATHLSDGREAAVLSEKEGELQIILEQGEPTPTSHVVSHIALLGGPVVNANGIAVLPAKSYLSTNVNSGRSELISASFNDVINFLVSEDDIAPSNDGTMFIRTHFTPAINRTEQVAASIALTNTSGGPLDDEAIYRTDHGTGIIEKIVRKGDPIPNGPGQFTGTALQASEAFSSPRIADDGTVAFQASITGSGIYGDLGLYIGNNGSFEVAARKNQVLPGDYSLALVWGFDYSSDGLLAYTANIIGSSAQDAVYLYDGTTTQKIIDPNDIAPNGDTFRGPSRSVKVNNKSEAAFPASLYPSGLTGMYLASNSKLIQLALAGEPAPENRGVYDQLTTNNFDYSMSDNGSIAFESGLLSDGDPEFAIYRYKNDSLQEVISTFDQIDGSDVINLDLAGRNDAQAEAINDAGDVLFKFELADGRTGVAVSRYIE